jgi:hypothetical protein
MSQLKISDLKNTEIEFTDLTEEEMESINGGSILSGPFVAGFLLGTYLNNRFKISDKIADLFV